MRRQTQRDRGRETGPSHQAGEVQRLHFGATGWAIDFEGCGEIVAGLQHVLRGWSLSVTEPSEQPPRAIVSRHAQGWRWTENGAPKPRDWDRVPPRSDIRVITDVHDAAIYWYLDENPSQLCMHGAAVLIGSALVCFPAQGRAGKSTLTACLAARGHTIFADDVLALDGNEGISLGFLPRLRIPLPAMLGPDTRAYLSTHVGPSDESWSYFDPGLGMAPLGRRAAVTSIVLLERRGEGEAGLRPGRTADALRLLIAENIIRQLPMAEIFDQLHALATSADKHVLHYCDPQEAAALLERAFG